MKKKLPDNQIVFYQSPDGSVNVEVLYAIAELFDTTKQNISLHLKNIFKEGELQTDPGSGYKKSDIIRI